MSLLRNTIRHTRIVPILPPLNGITGNRTHTPAAAARFDMTGFRGVEFILMLGTVGAAAAQFTPAVQESNDGATWTAVANEHLIGRETALNGNNDNTVARIGYIGYQRYVRMTVAVTANTGNYVLAVMAQGVGAPGAPLDQPHS